MKNTLSIIMLSALAAACGSAPAQPGETAAPTAAARGELDPVGTYAFSTTVQGAAVDGQLRITGSRGAWGGSFYSDATGELQLSSVRVDGQELRLDADTPDGRVHVRLVFSGDTFTGDWTLGADGGALRGRRLTR
ncbi:MAG TPA: hypothetical protein VMM12_16330 [Longimicrobiales bacterium]|nr:hypothetical protein [Longimicrobiales bacterium]